MPSGKDAPQQRRSVLWRRTSGSDAHLDPHEATLSELDRLIADLHAAGLVTVGRDRDGHATWTLTPQGTRLAELATAWGHDGPAGRVGVLLDTFERPAE
jgi:hypothetical protein